VGLVFIVYGWFGVQGSECGANSKGGNVRLAAWLLDSF
jgi:hypothetical protein